MDGTTLSLLAGAFVGWSAAVLGWLKWWHELRAKNIEREAKRDAEKELAQMRRRSLAESPYLTLNNELQGMLMFPPDGSGQPSVLLDGASNFLTLRTNEVGQELSQGDLVFLLVDNHGARAQEVEIRLEGAPIEFIHLQDIEGRENVQVIAYSFSPEQRGKEQVLALSFLSVNGSRDTHHYVTKHGVRFLKRTDPA